MGVISNLTVKVGADIRDLQRGLTEAGKEFQQLDQSIGAAQRAEFDKLTHSSDRLAQQTRGLTGAQALYTAATAEQIRQQLRSKLGMDDLHAGLARADAGLLALRGTTMLSATALSGFAAGGLLAAAAIGTVVAGLANATKFYFDNADATRDSRDALEGLGKTWEGFKFIIGGAVLGEGFSITRPIAALELALASVGVEIVKQIAAAKALLGVLEKIPGIGFVARAGKNMLTADPWANVVNQGDDKVFPLPELDNFGALEALGIERERVAKEWKKFTDDMSGRTAIADAQKWMRGVKDIGGVTSLAKTEQERYNDILSKAIEHFNALKRAIPTDVLRDWVATMKSVPFDKFFSPGQLSDLLRTRLTDNAGIPFAPHVQVPRIGMMSGLSPGETMPLPTSPVIASVLEPFRTAFKHFGQELPSLVFGALMGGGIGAIAGALGGEFTRVFQERLASITKDGKLTQALPGATAALGIAGMGIGVGIGGFQLGQRFGKTKGVLAGAGSGALAGAAFGSVVPGIGTAVGAGVGAIAGALGGFFGGRSKDKKDREAMEEARQQLLEQFGGMEKLKNLAAELGVNISKAFSTKKPQEFQAAVDQLNEALKRQQATLEGISNIVAGVNARAANVTSQGDLDVVGAGAVAAFALQIQQGTSAVAALQAITPAITAMKDAMAAGNLTLSESAERLLGLGAIVDANKVQFENLAASGSIVSAMLQGNIKDGALFAAVATDIGTQIQTVIDRGVPMAQVFALSQPQLQALWEAQQKWGFAVDETTSALLKEAEAQGFVGAAMKSINQQILDVLIAIGDVLGATIPDALRGLPAVADEAARGMQGAFNQVTGPRWTVPGEGWAGGEVSQMAEGGIVTRPTLAMIGEAGPEAVIPLDRGGITIILEQDGRAAAEFIVPYIPGVVHRYGLA